MNSSLNCPNCGAPLATTALGKLQDKHLQCPYCRFTVDVPDEFEVSEVEHETTRFGSRRVERTYRRKDLAGADAERVAARLSELARQALGHEGIVPESAAFHIEEITGGQVTEHVHVITDVRRSGDGGDGDGFDVEDLLGKVHSFTRSGPGSPFPERDGPGSLPPIVLRTNLPLRHLGALLKLATWSAVLAVIIGLIVLFKTVL